MFTLHWTEEANEAFCALEKDRGKKAVLKSVAKALNYLQKNPRHPGLNTHKYSALKGLNGEEVFEAYAQNKTPGAYRIFWCFGPGKNAVTIIAITPHP
jgi:hypothetical protein